MKIINLREENNRTIIQSVNGIAFFNEGWMQINVNPADQQVAINKVKQFDMAYDQ